MRIRSLLRRAVCVVTAVPMALGATVFAQSTPPYNPAATTGPYTYPAQPTTPAPQSAAPQPAAVPSSPSAAAAPAPAASTAAPMKQEELDQILAPLALYPDDLLSQILMASTYPIEIVQADRWVKQNKNLTGDALATELEKQSWDPSVKSLVNFPQVLGNLSDKLDVTVKVGDAFIADQSRVMNTIQSLRAKAQAAGNLRDSPEQKIIVQPAPATTVTVAGAPTQTIIIQPTNPQLIYVPTYNPTVVYGAWPYPYYPPYYYPPPPNYTAGAALLGFGVGVAVGAAWGYAWGGCNWHGGDVDIDINRNTNINNTRIDRSKYQANSNNRVGNNARGGANTFQHNPAHRGGVAYRDQATAKQFGGVSNAQATQARDAYRGRADTGRQDIARGSADQFKGNRPSTPTPQNRSTPSGQNRSYSAPSSANRSSSGMRSDAFSGSDRSGSSARASSQRGQASRSSSARPSGGARGGGRGGGRR
jgi:hypothetical protein